MVDTTDTTSAERLDQLRESLNAVQARIADACVAAGREPDEVRLLAVTKTFPATDVAALIDLGLRDFAENKDQEGGAKAAEVARLRPDADVRWYMVGRLQRNKARTVVRWADEVQSVDSARLADALGRAVANRMERGERAGPLDVQVQVSMDADPARGGCPVEEVPDLVSHIVQMSELRLTGLMTVAPIGADQDATFARLERLFQQVQRDYPAVVELSAGMSGDLERAVAHGSTCVRVGTALLGGRRLASRE
ncbi:YggS family pyridoxal phosphate-dependent enzyme [Haloechinothrix salitolerans]|uniref:Pyridoxal phosphate homeostasis protein n=1 Tax=Haloechinothrix salitolerans TaxID=926830 RepID=A0ABW2C5I0_9PSEU